MPDRMNIYQRMLNLFAGGRAWSRGAPARRSDGTPTMASDAKAVSYCLVGAVHRVAVDRAESDTALRFLNTAIEGGASNWNDKKKRTYGEVETLLKEFANDQ